VGGTVRVTDDRSLAPFEAFLHQLHRSQPWRRSAACSASPVRLFFPARGENAQAARAICQRCRVRSECLDYALEHGEPGVWGGTTARERTFMARRHD
jgi:WhiB family redox-sensing transcriptional regulator